MSLFSRLSSRLRPLPPGTRRLDGPQGQVILCGRPGDRYFERASLGRLSETTLAALLRKGVRGEGVTLDIGANIGLTSVLLARHGAGPVYAFEPHPATFALLERTLAANGLDGVTPVNLAVGRAAGTLPFFVDEDSSASHVVLPDAAGREGSIEVPITTVDAFRQEIAARISFIKIDAEGAEPDILAGAAETLAEDQPGVFVEFNLFTLMALSNVNPRQMLGDLRDLFPYVYRYADGTFWAIESDRAVVDFLHFMLTRNEITTDLYCTFVPL